MWRFFTQFRYTMIRSKTERDKNNDIDKKSQYHLTKIFPLSENIKHLFIIK